MSKVCTRTYYSPKASCSRLEAISVQMVCDSSHVLVGFNNGSLELFSRRDRHLRRVLFIPNRGRVGRTVTAIDLSPDLIIAGFNDGSVEIRDTSDGHLIIKPDLGTDDTTWITGLRLSQCLKSLVVCCNETILLNR